MNDEGTEVRPSGEARFAVVGDEATPDGRSSADGSDVPSLSAAVDDAGALVDTPDADVVVAVGEAALSRVAPVTDAPILAVDVGGPHSVPRSVALDLVSALTPGEFSTTTQPLVTVECGAERTRALFDVTLVTADPARISEYSVHSGGEEVDRFRADGVVLATAMGSHGYAHAAGGPVLTADADSLVAVPIAPFAIGADHWVLPSTETTLRVEREDAPVDCFADTDRVGAVTPGEPVRVRPDGVVRFVRPEWR
ncbi:ATP-NAD kinase [Halomarina salina]|uniref:ATP-NAD kinase n=1 Tax=Halomarina salina TaxID=1872699 RepID=A0ABD5RIV0_9EURY|nr:ATP-NAD kinase [Halomarina salina]